MRRKIALFGITVVILLTLVIISNVPKEETLSNLSPEEVTEKLLTNIFTVPYDFAMEEYAYKYKESSSEEDLERDNYIFRDDIFKKYFLENGYKNFYYRRYNLIYYTYAQEHKFDIVVKSINIDMRDTSDENTKTCYFTVEYDFVFLDTEKEPVTMNDDGELSLKKVSDTWLVNHINLHLEQLY